MRIFQKNIRKNNKIANNLDLTGATFTNATADMTAATIGSITSTTITNNSNAQIKGIATVSTGVFGCLRIPIVAHAVSGSMWVSGNGSYFFIRAKGTTKSGSLA